MRFIFISLLATNFVLALWIYFSSKSDDPIATGEPVVSQVQESKSKPEGTPGLVSNAQADERPVSPVVQPTEGAELCTVIGPFNNLAQADILVEQLAGLGVRADLRKVEVPVKKNFWLYLDPLATKADAKKKLAELQDQGVDSYIIPKGDLVNGISIGLFVESYRAEIRKKELADLGYEVSVRVDVSTAEQSWVVAKAKEAVVVSPATWVKLLEGGDDVTYKQNYCSDVASSQ